MVCAVNKIDSNVTGVRYAEEECLGELPGVGGVDAVWYPGEPNSYSDFGGSLSTVARNPINPSRQRKKGTVTDLDASGGFNTDFTQNNLSRLLQGFFFADMREKGSTAPMNGTSVILTAVATGNYSATAGLGVVEAGDLIMASGFANAGNNGLKLATAATPTSISAAGLSTETPMTSAKLKVVGHQFAAGELDIETVSGNPRLVADTFDMTTLGLIPGEWIYLGGDGVGFGLANNSGFARVSVVNTDYLQFDKTDWTPVAETGTTKTVRVFYGDVIRNEPAPADIVRRTYQIERTLGQDIAGFQAEYLVGAVANEFTLNVPQADKVNADITFVATDNQQRDGSEGLKPGVRAVQEALDPFNTSSDFSRIKLALVDPGSSNPSPLFAFATELTLTVNNNVTPTKAIGVLGAFDTTAGTFEVGGSINAYFANIQAVRAVRENADVTLDLIAVKKNAGILFDIPLLSLGDGRLNVEQDNPIMLTLENMAAESSFGHTLLFQAFTYLPTSAM